MERFTSLSDLANDTQADRIIKDATTPQEFATQVYQQAMDIIERDSGQTAARLRKNTRQSWPDTHNLKQALLDAVGDMYANGCIQLLADKSLQYGVANFDPFRVAMRLFPYWDFSKRQPERIKAGLIDWLDSMDVYSFKHNATNEITISGCGVITIEDAASVYADRGRKEPTAREVVEELSALRETGWADDQPSQNFGDTSDPDNRNNQEVDYEDKLGAIMNPFEDELHRLVEEELDAQDALNEIDPLEELVIKGLDKLRTERQITADTHAQQVEFARNKVAKARKTLTFQMSKSHLPY